MDSIVNQAAKWSHMTGAQSHPAVTIRGIINRGGEQGAQHSQSLHSWFSHIPGLRVLMPYSVADARDMLISATICKDPVIYIDDRWLYETEEVLQPIKEKEITEFKPKVIKEGVDISLVATSFSTKLAMDLVPMLEDIGIKAEVIDVRSLNPFDPETIVKSVKKTAGINGYAKFLREVLLVYTNQEEKRYLRNLDWNSPYDLDIAVPFFANRLREVVVYVVEQRQKLKFQNSHKEYQLEEK